MYKNLAEEAFCQWIEKRNYSVTKRGWPDFFCISGKGEIICVEVKDTAVHPLKREQQIVASFLKSHGIKTYRWDPTQQILEDTDAARARIKRARTPKRQLLQS